MSNSKHVTTLMVLAGLVFAAGSGPVHGQRAQRLQASPDVAAALPAPASNAVVGADGRIAAIVLLEQPSTAEVYAGELRRLGPGQGDRIAAVTRGHVDLLQAQQAGLVNGLRTRGIAFEEIYRVQKALNAVAVRVAPADFGRLRSLPGVARVELLESHELHNSTSVPFIGAPAVWENALGLASAATGENVSVAIIDTGIDYMHAMFGGSGALEDYQANDPSVVEAGTFPTARVVGGTDFAGDAYNGNNAAVPDADPMDCNGHGSHVAGTAAGGGVNVDGSAYTGPYDSTTPFASMRIGPGVAPHADLYALRVFGCGGSTQLTNVAIEWAMDPNDDNDLSDRLDVINMSLGSSFGSAFSSSSIAADNAAAAGVVVVASAGNSGDTYFVGGSPGSGSRVVSVANVADDGVPGVRLVVNAPAPIAGNYRAQAAAFTDPSDPQPPAPSGQTGDVVLAVDATGGPNDACQPLTNAAAIAGNFALVDRGSCNFSVKLDNVNAAGASGMIVANNAAEFGLISMGGAATAEVNFPSAFVSLDTGNLIKAQLGAGVNVTFDGSTSAADTPSASTSRGPRRAFAGTEVVNKPDVAAPGSLITSALTGVVCPDTAGDPSCVIAGSQPLTISGTSMAAPHIAGVAALLRQLHPDWSVDAVSNAIVNGGLRQVTIDLAGAGDRYGSSRVGAGRTDVPATASNLVTVGNADAPSMASISFDLEPVLDASAQKRLRVTNHDAVPHTFNLELVPVLDVPGVTFSLPAGSLLSVPAQSTVEVPVNVAFTVDAMVSQRDPTVAPTQAGAAGTLPRHFLTEESAVLEFHEGGEARISVPLYATHRPYSAMSATDVLATGSPAADATVPLALSGLDVCTGSRLPGPDCAGNYPRDRVSIVSLFELAAMSPREPDSADDYHDLRYAGVTFDEVSGRLQFGIATWGEWNTLASDVSFSVYIDTDEDGVSDFALFSSNNGTLAGAAANDVFLTGVVNLATNGIGGLGAPNAFFASQIDTGIYNSNVLMLSVPPAALGLANPGNTNFRWKVESCFGGFYACEHRFGGFFLDEVGGVTPGGAPALSYDFANRALDFNAPFGLPDFDLNGVSYAVDFVAANAVTNGTLGALVLHHHNTNGKRAEVVALQADGTADIAVNGSASTSSPGVGATSTVTFVASNSGGNDASDVEAVLALPVQVAYVSHSGDGAFDPGTGVWTIGALAAGASASIDVTVQAVSSGTANVTAQVGANALPLDPNSANNSASVTLGIPSTADLSISVVAGSASVAAGADVVFTLTLGNSGPDQAVSIVVEEAFTTSGGEPSSPGAFTASTGSYNPTTGVWTIGALSATAGTPATLELTFAAPAVAEPLMLEASVASGTADGNPANNTASASVEVVLPDGIFSDGFED